MKLKKFKNKNFQSKKTTILISLLLSLSFFIFQTQTLVLLAEESINESENKIINNSDFINEIEDINENDLTNNTDVSNSLNFFANNKETLNDRNIDIPQNEDLYSDSSNQTSGNSYTNFASSFDSCLALDKSHQIYFYSLNSSQSDNYPISFYLILALCALDKFKLDETIRSPKLIENVVDQSLSLKVETDYPLEYLLYAILLKQSDSAVITLSEALSSNENKLIEQLNKKAELLKLSNTQFNYISLKDSNNRTILKENYKIDEQTQLAPFSATSSTSDIAKLYKTLLNNNILNKILSVAEYSYYSQNILNLFTNPFSIIWSLYPNEVQNALSYEDDNISTYICNLNFADFDCLIILNKYSNKQNGQIVKEAGYYQSSLTPSISDQKKEALNEISDLRKKIRENWLISKLFSSQEEYKDTIEVPPFNVNLKFLNDIYYIHPINSNYISSEEFSLNKAKIKLPIKSGEKLAELKITLENKKVINIDLYAKDNYRLRNEFIDEFQPIFQKYKGICILIIVLVFLFLFLAIYRFVKFIFKPFYKKRRS